MTRPTAHTRRWLLTGGAAGAPPSRSVALGDACLARHGVVCQSCADVCTERAIRFTLRVGGPPLPEVTEDACTRCGECVAACPAAAITLHGDRHEDAHGAVG